MQQHRNLVDVVRIHRGEDGTLFDIRKERDLATLLVGNRVHRAAQENVRLNADRAQLLHRMLRRLGLDLTRARDVRHERQMHEDHVVATLLHAELTDRLEERQRLDVAHRAADFDHAHVGIACTQTDAVLDLIGDVRNDLHCRTEVIAATFLGDDALVDAAGRKVAVARSRRTDEALVMAQIEIGFGAVTGDEHFAVLKRTHGAWIDIDVRIQLHHADLEATRLENGT